MRRIAAAAMPLPEITDLAQHCCAWWPSG